MNDTVEHALDLWGLKGANCRLIAARENAVYKVEDATQTFALRLHRQGYRTDLELWSELKWMAATSAGGIDVPAPVPSVHGEMLHLVDDVQVDVLTWLSGEPLDATLARQTGPDRAALFRRLGTQMARLHRVSDAWTPPKGFTRCQWDQSGLLGEAPLWDRFWDNPALTAQERALFTQIRQQAQRDLTRISAKLDFGLIHADLVTGNVMVDGPRMRFIDFDDGGYGFRVFDIATALLKHINAPDYPILQDALISGYRSERPIDLAALDLFLVLRAATYVGWNITRMGEDNDGARNARFIKTAKRLALAYLA